MNLIADVANQALDAAGIDETIGDIEEGTRPAQVLLRAYGQNLRQLLRAANWDFARREAPLVMLADATGSTPNVGTQVPRGQFIYEYAYPIDACKIRFIPWHPFQNPGAPQGNIIPPNANAPLTTATPQFAGRRLIPAKFVITNDPNYPPEPGQIFWEVQGQSPQGRVVIMCNVYKAMCIYTTTALYPSMWDSLFREAMVALLASNVALPLSKDKKFGMQMRKDNIEIAKAKIREARVVDGNESVASSDISVDWMRTRNTGGWGRGGHGQGGEGGGFGGFGGGFDAMNLADGSTF
jgi:hypothetical protein